MDRPAAPRIASLVLGFLLFATPALAQQAETRAGAAAFGDWRADAPGVRRKITPADLPPPFATAGAARSSRLVARPRDAKPLAPAGFNVELLAQGFSGPRVLRVAQNGDVFVAETSAGRVRVLRGRGADQKIETFAQGLDGPFGVAFHPPVGEPRFVYIATQTQVTRWPWRMGDMKPSGEGKVVVRILPGGGHSTRDIAFSPDGATLYVSVGSATNVAENIARFSPAQIAAFEKANGVGAAWSPEVDRAVVLAFDPEGRGKRTFATGLRNCAGLTVSPAGDPWCVVNERDMLGDDLPPDYATRVRDGGFYGWPWYYAGANEDPRHKGARPDLAGKVLVPDVLIQPHSAPLGIAFYTGEIFPPEWRGAYVTLHGSWNRSKSTGYKVVRLIFRDGAPTGEYEDFLTGFAIDDNNAWGRPVCVAVAADGALLVGEDVNGTIWRVSCKS